jgi:hypothetical protein
MNWYNGNSAGLEGFAPAVLMLLLWAALTIAATIIVVWWHEARHGR